MSAAGAEIALGIARQWAVSNISAKFASFDQLMEYRAALNAVGLDCNNHFQALAEAIYPIHLTDEAFDILTGTTPPRVAEAFIGHGAMSLTIIAANCSGN